MNNTAATEKTYRSVNQTPFRKLRAGKPVPGTSGEVYADDTVRDGYLLVTSEEAQAIKIGDMVPVGTQYAFVDFADPRPGRSIEQVTSTGEVLNAGRKVVNRDWRRVEGIGKPYEMSREKGYYDDNRSTRDDGFVHTGSYRVMVCRVYFAAVPAEVR